VKLHKSEKSVVLYIEDNGKGIFNNDSDGKGIKNVKARVESLNGKWKSEKSDGKGLSHEIIIPF
jgi:two-component system, NarL family, sensor histidine kinase LiaS